MKFSDYKLMNKPLKPPFDARVIGLDFTDRKDLYERIDARVDGMMSRGMLSECEEMYLSGVVSSAIGYNELFPFFGGLEELSSCVGKIKQNSRRYAKRQLTWFRRDARINWIYLCNSVRFDKIIDSCEKIVAKTKNMCYN
jgi:tRNA dimethylallyltransferase